MDLGLDSSHERFIGEAGGIEIGGEGNDEVERDFKFIAAGEGQEIDAAVHGHDPAIQ